MRIEGWGAAVAMQDDRERESGEGKGCNRVGHFRIEPLGRKWCAAGRTAVAENRPSKKTTLCTYNCLSFRGACVFGARAEDVHSRRRVCDGTVAPYMRSWGLGESAEASF